MADGVAPRNGNLVAWFAGAAIILSVVNGFWSVANPRTDISELKKEMRDDLQRVNKEMRGDYLSIREHNEFLKRMEKVEAQLALLNHDMVRREEHQVKWDADKSRMDNTQKQIDAIRAEYGTNFTLGDKLKELQKQLDDLRNHPH